MALFEEKGYDNTTLVEIAAVAGISTRTLYRYYPAKEDILFVFSKQHVKMIGKFAKQLPRKMNIKEKIVEVMLKDISTISQSEHFKLHTNEKSGSLLAHKFEMENMFFLEGVYQGLLEEEQKKHHIENSDYCKAASIVILGIYRQATDRLFHLEGSFNYELFKKHYEQCLNVVWDGMQHTLFAQKKTNQEEKRGFPPSMEN